MDTKDEVEEIDENGDEKVMMAEAVEYAMDVQEFVPDEVIEAKE